MVTKKSDINEAAAEPEKGYALLVSPFGIETTVPDSIKGALLDSGYTAK